MKTIYLDYNATTPIDPAVVDAMRPYLNEVFGNPSSIHPEGIKAKLAVENARKQVAGMLNAHLDEIIFTSGGTESNNFAIKGIALASQGKGKHIITSSVEHPSVVEVCKYLEKLGFRITYLPVDEFGQVNPLDLEGEIDSSTILITIIHANNETGTIQPIEEIGNIARNHEIPFHSDAAQSCGKIPVNVAKLNVDLLSVAGHKLYAPKGVGAIYIRRGIRLEKLIHGADHEQNLRAGTENVMSIAGFGKACEISKELLQMEEEDQTSLISSQKEMRDLLYHMINNKIPGARINGHPEHRLPNTLNISFPGIEAGLFLERIRPVAASAGAACHSGSEIISPVLEAMKVPPSIARGAIRFSLGRMTTTEEIKEAAEIIVNKYREISGGTQSETGPPSFPQEIKLTQYSHGLGCACKIRPQYLEKILKGIPPPADPDVIIGIETSDDAAVYRINDSTAIVQTVDFFPPMVDDPLEFGRIAAANALSDIYAMGAKPLFALSIVGFPEKVLPVSVFQMILKGALEKIAEAGISIIGGHTIDDPEPKFGLVVTGSIDPAKILRNSGAKPGDALILTKPLGSGIISAAIKRGLADQKTIRDVITVMAGLNKPAAEVMSRFPVNGCTDVTGFGLLGHLKEIVTGANVSAVVYHKNVPVIAGTWDLAASGVIPGGTVNNLEFVADIVHWEPGVPELTKIILADAQTSGGLLISIPMDIADDFLLELHKTGISDASLIGIIQKGKPAIRVKDKTAEKEGKTG